jgi:hypothetical protein
MEFADPASGDEEEEEEDDYESDGYGGMELEDDDEEDYESERSFSPDEPCVVRDILSVLTLIAWYGPSPHFACHGKVPVDLINLHMLGLKVGDWLVPLPLQSLDDAKKSGFLERTSLGRGEQRIQEPNGRSTFHVLPANLSFLNPLWTEDVQVLASRCASLLGIEKPIVAKLHKLLIHEHGDYFKPQRDVVHSEDQFATLIIQLPSIYEGGMLVISQNDDLERADQSTVAEPGAAVKPMYAAFLTDCMHEVLPLEKGIRTCLVFHLCYAPSDSQSEDALEQPPGNAVDGGAKKENLRVQRELAKVDLREYLSEWFQEFEEADWSDLEHRCKCGQPRHHPIVQTSIDPFKALKLFKSTSTAGVALLLDHMLTTDALSRIKREGLQNALWELQGKDRMWAEALLDAIRELSPSEQFGIFLGACSYDDVNGVMLEVPAAEKDGRVCLHLCNCMVLFDAGMEGIQEIYVHKGDAMQDFSETPQLTSFTFEFTALVLYPRSGLAHFAQALLRHRPLANPLSLVRWLRPEEVLEFMEFDVDYLFRTNMLFTPMGMALRSADTEPVWRRLRMLFPLPDLLKLDWLRGETERPLDEVSVFRIEDLAEKRVRLAVVLTLVHLGFVYNISKLWTRLMKQMKDEGVDHVAIRLILKEAVERVILETDSFSGDGKAMGALLFAGAVFLAVKIVESFNEPAWFSSLCSRAPPYERMALICECLWQSDIVSMDDALLELILDRVTEVLKLCMTLDPKAEIDPAYVDAARAAGIFIRKASQPGHPMFRRSLTVAEVLSNTPVDIIDTVVHAWFPFEELKQVEPIKSNSSLNSITWKAAPRVGNKRKQPYDRMERKMTGENPLEGTVVMHSVVESYCTRKHIGLLKNVDTAMAARVSILDSLRSSGETALCDFLDDPNSTEMDYKRRRVIRTDEFNQACDFYCVHQTIPKENESFAPYRVLKRILPGASWEEQLLTTFCGPEIARIRALRESVEWS